jgi:hypothetical protein
LMELEISCIFFSQVLGCLTNSSSLFPLIAISSLRSEILSSVCSILLEWPYILFCISVAFYFLRYSILYVTSLILSIFALNSFISLFMVLFVSVWYLFRAPMISFICFCVFSYFLVLLSWNFLSTSCTFGDYG